MRRRLFLALPSLLMLQACDQETAPPPLVQQGRAAVQNAIPASRTQSYDLELSSAGDGQFKFTNVLHVTRRRSGAGWQTSIRIDAAPVPAGQSPLMGEIVSIEVDETGDEVITTRSGQRKSVTRGRVTVNKDLRGVSVSEARNGLADVYDVLPRILFTRSEAAARLSRLERAHPGQGERRGGRVAYRQILKGASVELEYDATTGLPVRTTMKKDKGGSMTIDHTYSEGGGLIVQTASQSASTGAASPKVTTRRFTHITIDGKEIIP